MTIPYEDFLAQKAQLHVASGFDIDIDRLHPALMDYQKAVVRWAVKRGRAAIFGDTGNGKTVMQTEWADQVAGETGGQILIAAPLSVAQQTVEMARDLQGIDIGYARNAGQIQHAITITNYEMLEHFDLNDFAGLVLDESSIIKHQDGKTRNQIIEMAQNVPYRLACTATPSPNDYMELGNHAEFLGVMKMVEMLAMFFTHDGGETSKWMLKGHGRTRFWEWMASWSVCFRDPSDLGFDATRHKLPPLNIHKIIVPSEVDDGSLFPEVAEGLLGRNKARRDSMDRRVQEAAKIANSLNEPVVTWCLLNDENDLLKDAINDSRAIVGSDSIDAKEAAIHGFSHGEYLKLISKTSITGAGLNWQHCSKSIFSSINDSFESFYQAIKRFHRFGQINPVDIWVIYSEAEGPVYDNIMRKWAQHEQMQKEMVSHMKEAMQREIHGATMDKTEYTPQQEIIWPGFL